MTSGDVGQFTVHDSTQEETSRFCTVTIPAASRSFRRILRGKLVILPPNVYRRWWSESVNGEFKIQCELIHGLKSRHDRSIHRQRKK